ncbi:CAP domain-containing protein [Streptomyces sp. NBC_01481]|uniref:CAP domain-containing protein n=1 Tax=Streptomyces sp. NBC_01481 TaxID=2975869 RepID=UPI00224E5384|nr:CAP domain-containing protein [Streptomyces sp. NBC_01481]MCX4584484.1 CAP domain-containing protein [Streptomyces sp. NBC_01481]
MHHRDEDTRFLDPATGRDSTREGRGGRRRAGAGRHGRRGRAGGRPVAAIAVAGTVAVAVVAGGVFALSGSDEDSASTRAAASVQQAPADASVGGVSKASPTPTASVPPSAVPSATSRKTKGPTAKPSAAARRTAGPRTAPAQRRQQSAPARAGAGAPAAGTPATGKAADYVQRIAALVNAERAKAGCSPLRVDRRVQAAAQAHADDMAARNYYEHVSPEGRHADDRMKTAGYPAGKWGENIHKGPKDPVSAMRDWMDSPGHRENILDCGFKDLGVGVNFSANGTWWVQNFGG